LTRALTRTGLRRVEIVRIRIHVAYRSLELGEDVWRGKRYFDTSDVGLEGRSSRNTRRWSIGPKVFPRQECGLVGRRLIRGSSRECACSAL
jgi:hypothetical protein